MSDLLRSINPEMAGPVALAIIVIGLVLDWVLSHQ